MRKLTTWSAVPVLALLCSACGALFNSGPQMVNFTSSPEGAEVWINGTPRGTTPISLGLAKNENYTVLFKMDGHRDFGTELQKQVNAGYVVLDVLGGVIPVVIDAATGSWYKLSASSVHGSLAAAGEPDGQLTRDQLVMLNLGISLERILDTSARDDAKESR